MGYAPPQPIDVMASSSADAGVPPPEANTWVQCDECRKWRRIDAEAAVAARAAPRWHCRMNADAAYAFCAAAQEEDAAIIYIFCQTAKYITINIITFRST